MPSPRPTWAPVATASGRRSYGVISHDLAPTPPLAEPAPRPQLSANRGQQRTLLYLPPTTDRNADR